MLFKGQQRVLAGHAGGQEGSSDAISGYQYFSDLFESWKGVGAEMEQRRAETGWCVWFLFFFCYGLSGMICASDECCDVPRGTTAVLAAFCRPLCRPFLDRLPDYLRSSAARHLSNYSGRCAAAT